MSHKRFFASLASVALAGVAYAAPTGPISRIGDGDQPAGQGQFAVVNPAGYLLSTGFEPGEGWDPGVSSCGAAFVAGCGNPPGSGIGGFPNVCVPKNHPASLNCCIGDPNERTGWYKSGSDQHCSGPTISDVHPSPLKGESLYHLRFFYDANGGNPPGCSGFASACRQTAAHSDGVAFPVPNAKVITYKVDIACSDVLGSSIQLLPGEWGPPFVYGSTISYFYYLGGLYTYDLHTGSFAFGGYWSDVSPGYAQHMVVFDPCNDVVEYYYGDFVDNATGDPVPDGLLDHYYTEPFGFIPPNSTDGARNMTVNAGFYITDHYGEMWDMDNISVVAGAECSDACCDGTTGVCSDGVAAGDCMGDQQVWYENQECGNLVDPTSGDPVECIRHSGACCDRNPGAGGPGPEGACVDGTYPEDCTGQNLTWYKYQTCADITCDEIPGSCCDLLTGECEDGVLQALCTGNQQRWGGKGSLCADVECDAVLGACCDGDTFGGCEQTTQAGCNCLKCDWFKLRQCADIDCLHEAIPTVSEWGLVVLTLLLLTGAKVYFGRRQALA